MIMNLDYVYAHDKAYINNPIQTQLLIIVLGMDDLKFRF